MLLLGSSLLKALLVLWFGLTVLRSIDRLEILSRHDAFGLVPRWGFFKHAPVEFRVWYRTIDLHGTPGEWTEVDFVGVRTWHEGLWHPLKRVEKSFAVNPRNIARLCLRGADRQTIESSHPYLSLVNQIRPLAFTKFQNGSATFQFLISKRLGCEFAYQEVPILLSRLLHIGPSE
jgi:hypothetical protein